MSVNPIIVFTGQAGSGKDTCATAIIEKLHFSKVSFAYSLKKLCARLFEWDFDQLDRLDYKEAVSHHLLSSRTWTERAPEISIDQFGREGIRDGVVEILAAGFQQIQPDWTRRRILQVVGTDIFRQIDSQHWVKKELERINQLFAAGVPGLVLADARFLNEVDALRQNFPTVVIQTRRLSGESMAGTPLHISETEMNQIVPDYVLEAASGDLETLRQGAIRIAESVLV